MGLRMDRRRSGHTGTGKAARPVHRRRTLTETMGYQNRQRVKARLRNGEVRWRAYSGHDRVLSNRLPRNVERALPHYPTSEETRLQFLIPRPRTWSGTYRFSTSAQRFRIRLRHGVSYSLRARATHAGDNR